MNWQLRRCYYVRHLGLLLLVTETAEAWWEWEVSGEVGGTVVSMHGVPIRSLAIAKNEAVVAAARLVRIAA